VIGFEISVELGAGKSDTDCIFEDGTHKYHVDDIIGHVLEAYKCMN